MGTPRGGQWLSWSPPLQAAMSSAPGPVTAPPAQLGPSALHAVWWLYTPQCLVASSRGWGSCSVCPEGKCHWHVSWGRTANLWNKNRKRSGKVAGRSAQWPCCEPWVRHRPWDTVPTCHQSALLRVSRGLGLLNAGWRPLKSALVCWSVARHCCWGSAAWEGTRAPSYSSRMF